MADTPVTCRPVRRRSIAPFDGAACNAVAFDWSGQYLAVGGSDARIYATKQVCQGNGYTVA